MKTCNENDNLAMSCHDYLPEGWNYGQKIHGIYYGPPKPTCLEFFFLNGKSPGS